MRSRNQDALFQVSQTSRHELTRFRWRRLRGIDKRSVFVIPEIDLMTGYQYPELLYNDERKHDIIDSQSYSTLSCN